MPKAKPAPVGIHADTKTYDTGVSMYLILDDRIEGGKSKQIIFESSKPETRDYVLARMQERAGKVEKLVELVLDN